MHIIYSCISPSTSPQYLLYLRVFGGRDVQNTDPVFPRTLIKHEINGTVLFRFFTRESEIHVRREARRMRRGGAAGGRRRGRGRSGGRRLGRLNTSGGKGAGNDSDGRTRQQPSGVAPNTDPSKDLQPAPASPSVRGPASQTAPSRAGTRPARGRAVAGRDDRRRAAQGGGATWWGEVEYLRARLRGSYPGSYDAPTPLGGPRSPGGCRGDR